MTQIIISEEDRNNIQRSNAECESRMSIILYILKNNIAVDKKRFDDYQKEYSEKYLIFESDKKALETKYLANVKYSSWSLNYNTCELSYE